MSTNNNERLITILETIRDVCQNTGLAENGMKTIFDLCDVAKDIVTGPVNPCGVCGGPNNWDPVSGVCRSCQDVG